MKQPIEVIFKHVETVDISMDVYIPQAVTKENPVPILLWWHGGGLIQGTRKGISPHMLAAPERHNLCLVCPDYRLAPQTRMPGILNDCKTAMDFLHTSSEFAKATGYRTDPSWVVLSGSSAGGWLSLLAGIGIGFKACGLEIPRPVCGIAALYPITDLLDSFWKIKQHPVSFLDRVIENAEVEDLIDVDTAKTTWASLDGKRSILYHYMVPEAVLSQLLLDGAEIPEESFSVAHSLLSKDFNPLLIYITTGNIDGKVPNVQSLDVVKALKDIGARVEYHELDGLYHAFDKDASYHMEDMYQPFGKVSSL